jgi:hypothetical protein
MFLNGCMAQLRIVISDFEESNKKKVDGEDTGPGKGVRGKGEYPSRLPPLDFPFALPHYPFPLPLTASSGFSAQFRAKLRRHSFNQGDSK